MPFVIVDNGSAHNKSTNHSLIASTNMISLKRDHLCKTTQQLHLPYRISSYLCTGERRSAHVGASESASLKRNHGRSARKKGAGNGAGAEQQENLKKEACILLLNPSEMLPTPRRHRNHNNYCQTIYFLLSRCLNLIIQIERHSSNRFLWRTRTMEQFKQVLQTYVQFKKGRCINWSTTIFLNAILEQVAKRF